MKKIFLTIAALTFASLVFAVDAKSTDQDKAKCDDKPDKACCCCQDAKACSDKDAKCNETAKDAKPAETPAKK